MNYSFAIKELRKRKFLTQVELSKLLGVSFASVNRWEKGHCEPTMKVKRALNELFLEAKIIKGDK